MSIPDNPLGFAGAVDLSALANRSQNQSTAPTAESAYVRDITEEQLGSILELSQSVPVILEVYGPGAEPRLGALVDAQQGKMLLATLDASKAPQVVQALQIQGVPSVFLLLQGRPAPLFQGPVPDHEVEPVLQEVLRFAQQSGVTGVLPPPEESEQPEHEGEEEPPLSAQMQAAIDALGRNDLDQAEAAYRQELADNPGNQDAKAGLGHVGVLRRLAGASAESIRAAAAASPDDVQAQMLVADLDIAGGHLDDAFRRLLELFSRLDQDQRELVRERLLGYFDMAGPSHPSVLSARSQLMSLLY